MYNSRQQYRRTAQQHTDVVRVPADVHQARAQLLLLQREQGQLAECTLCLQGMSNFLPDCPVEG